MRRNCTLAIPLWGDRYVERFLKYTLPSLRAPGNLPALAEAFDLEISVYTGTLEASAISRAMSDTGLPHVLHVLAPHKLSGHPGTTMKELFQLGFDRAWDRKAIFAPVCADTVYSNGFFKSAAEEIVDGYRAVMTQGSGVCVEDIGAWLDARCIDGVLPLAPRAFFGEFMQCTNKGAHLPTWPGTQLYPAQIFWPIGDDAVLMRCCHMYPVLLDAVRHATMQYSPDNDLAEITLDDPEQVSWLLDSDDGFFLGLAERGNPSLEEAKPSGDTSLEHFCSTWMSPWKARYFEKRIIWHAGGIPIDAALQAQAASDAVINGIMNVYRRVHP